MKKKLLSLFLALTLALSLAAPAWAATPEEAQDSAQLLYNLGLFQGSGTNEDGSPRFALERAPTRAEAVTILVRLLGAEEAAQAQTWTTPFTDVPDWAQSYVGYAYAKGYTTGVEPTRFGSSTPVSTAQTATFLRADAAVVSANALYAPKKGEDKTLLQDLLDSGAISGSTVVIWDYAPLLFDEDFASFLFYPVDGSPASFTSFKLDKVTVNGLSCQTLQVTTPEEVSAYLASIGYDAGGFGYVEITYDEDKAQAAATEHYTDENGKNYPLLAFSFTYTATQADGSQVKGSFTDNYYLDE